MRKRTRRRVFRNAYEAMRYYLPAYVKSLEETQPKDTARLVEEMTVNFAERLRKTLAE